MKLSVLIPGIPSRFDKIISLYNKISKQVEDHSEVEILIFIDNKNRSIGYKRDALVQIAKGEYLAFVDDDDDVSEEYIECMLAGCNKGVDIVSIRQHATINDIWTYVDFSINNKINEEIQPGSMTLRLPFHVCAVKTEIAQKHRFKDVSYSEDWDWMERVLQDVKTEYKVNDVIHFYKYHDEVSEAPVESNEVFTNLDLEHQKREDEKSDN